MHPLVDILHIGIEGYEQLVISIPCDSLLLKFDTLSVIVIINECYTNETNEIIGPRLTKHNN